MYFWLGDFKSLSVLHFGHLGCILYFPQNGVLKQKLQIGIFTIKLLLNASCDFLINFWKWYIEDVVSDKNIFIELLGGKKEASRPRNKH